MKIPLLLASASPRRHEILSRLELPFEVKTKPVQEILPAHIEALQAASYLAALKADAYKEEAKDYLIITADTIVVHEGQLLGKPQNELQAISMLGRLSGSLHQVITAVCLSHKNRKKVFEEKTEVHFRELDAAWIKKYVHEKKPMDKAGSYGVQDWLGMIGIKKIVGDYYNVMGFPAGKFYEELARFKNEINS